jgi:heme/copper-type cytochrome/quinol oxidase subunit 2
MMIHQLESRFLTIAYCDAAEPWQLGFQDAATPIMQGIIDLHHDIFFFLILILVFVLWMLVRALWHFHEKKNPIPQRIVHGTTIEIIWTIFPSIILMFIAIPSFALLYSMDEVVVDPAVTIKAIGHQWYWTYEYSDYNSSDEQSLTFDSYMIPRAISLKDYGSWISRMEMGDGSLGSAVAPFLVGEDTSSLPQPGESSLPQEGPVPEQEGPQIGARWAALPAETKPIFEDLETRINLVWLREPIWEKLRLMPAYSLCTTEGKKALRTLEIQKFLLDQLGSANLDTIEVFRQNLAEDRGESNSYRLFRAGLPRIK